MKDLLVILHPRSIHEALDSYAGLNIDKLWIDRMTEWDIAEQWELVMAEAAGYDRLIVVSDDAVVRQPALDAVIRLLDDGHPVATGWSNLSYEDFRTNLCKTPLAPEPAIDAYDLYHISEVMTYPDPVVPTWLVALCITGMSYEMWNTYPFMVYADYPGCCSDFHLSKRLEIDGVPMVAAREAMCYHIKTTWNTMDTEHRKRLLIGEEPMGIRLETR